VSITPQTRNWLRQSAALDGAVVSQTLLNLLERVEALEAAQPAQPAPPPAPAGGLVERVATAIHPSICADPNLYRHEARAAIREVAAWLDSNEGLPDLATSRNADGWEMAAQILNQEADR